MIVLASASASRAAMLAAAGVAFRCLPADLDERALEDGLGGAGDAEVALALAVAKAAAVSAREPGALVLGGDSLVEAGGRRFAKAMTRDEAAEHLRWFSGRTMAVHSAAALVRDGATVWHHAGLARLPVRALSDAFIARYLDGEWPQVRASVGVFRIEGPGAQLFTAIDGDTFTVRGLPLLPLLGALRDLGELPA